MHFVIVENWIWLHLISHLVLCSSMECCFRKIMLKWLDLYNLIVLPNCVRTYEYHVHIITSCNLITTSLNLVPNAQVCVYLTIHYICAKKVYYTMTTKCRKRHAAAYWTTQNAFPYFWSNKSQIIIFLNH
jgi:hypothetical protein